MRFQLPICFLLTLTQLIGQEDGVKFDDLYDFAIGNSENQNPRKQIDKWNFKLWSMNLEHIFIPHRLQVKTEYLVGFDNHVEVAITTDHYPNQSAGKDFSRIGHIRIGYSASRYDSRFHYIIGELAHKYKPRNQIEMHDLFFSRIENLNQYLPIGFNTNITPHDLVDLNWCVERVELNSVSTGSILYPDLPGPLMSIEVFFYRGRLCGIQLKPVGKGAEHDGIGYFRAIRGDSNATKLVPSNTLR